MKFICLAVLLCCAILVNAQTVAPEKSNAAGLVNVFLGSSGDHGQMSPAASAPYGMLSIGPQTYPNLHMGYEHKAKIFLGFTHNRFEGVGCQGSGGAILIKPYMGANAANCILTKAAEVAGPGRYEVAFTNHIAVHIAATANAGIEDYQFPAAGEKGFVIDLSHTLANNFINEQHQLLRNGLTGWIDARTTCNVGIYRVYYAVRFSQPVVVSEAAPHQLTVQAANNARQIQLRIALSSVDTAHALAALPAAGSRAPLEARCAAEWNAMLNRVKVTGDAARRQLFYSLLYRTLQSPYVVSEQDGSYRATNGSLQQGSSPVYNGWAIWDNYRTQLPLLSVLYPERYKDIISSMANFYKYGKKNYATLHEPSNTVRTEHAIVVLLDAYRKGYPVNFKTISDSLIAEADRLDFSHPDKALESSYDTWALAQILLTTGNTLAGNQYLQKAADYSHYWLKDFRDLSKPDVDKVSARGLYQGTIWQYRWFVPFDIKGLVSLCGGGEAYLKQLDQFFDNDYYNHANEPDIQAPLMYNGTAQPWKSQALMHRYAADTVVQYYFNDNSRGIDPFIDVIYKNRPDAYIRTMDDDAGAMSAWYIFAACGFSPACVGWPVYYLNVPLFNEVQLAWPNRKPFRIKVNNFSLQRRYIQSALLNGKPLTRNWLTQQEIMQGGTLVINAAGQPDKQWGVGNPWVTSLNQSMK